MGGFKSLNPVDVILAPGVLLHNREVRSLLLVVCALVVCMSGLSTDARASGSDYVDPEGLPSELWVVARPELALLAFQYPFAVHRLEVGGGVKLKKTRLWGFGDIGIIHDADLRKYIDDREQKPSFLFEGGLQIARVADTRSGEFFAGPRFTFGALDFSTPFVTGGGVVGVHLGKPDQKAWMRLTIEGAVVVPLRFPEWTTLSFAASAGVLVR